MVGCMAEQRLQPFRMRVMEARDHPRSAVCSRVGHSAAAEIGALALLMVIARFML